VSTCPHSASGRACLHQFDIEHTIKFQKPPWAGSARRRDCQQAARWTAIILAGYAQLVLTRPLAADQRLPWERLPDPGRVRRDFPRGRALLPTLASPRNPAPPAADGPRRVM